MIDENKLDIELLKAIMLDFFCSQIKTDAWVVYDKKTKDTKFKIGTFADIPDLYVSKQSTENIDICIKNPMSYADDVKIIEINKHQMILMVYDTENKYPDSVKSIISDLFSHIHIILFDKHCSYTKESFIEYFNKGYEIFNPFDIANITEQSIEQDDVYVCIKYQINKRKYMPESFIRITYNNDDPYSNHEIDLIGKRGKFWEIVYDNIYDFRIYKNDSFTSVIRSNGLPNELIKLYNVLKERKLNDDKERYKQTITNVTLYIDSLQINKRYLVCRGKSLKTGEWVYGFYHEDNDHTAIISAYDFKQKSIKDEIVYPETVSQCTGAKCSINYADKSNDKMYIFEGDILRTYHCGTLMGVCMVRYAKDPTDDIVYPGYECRTLYGGGYDDETLYSYCGEIGMDVIGNVYDNPEMLNEDYYASRPDEFDRDKKII